MTVKELIDALREAPASSEVYALVDGRKIEPAVRVVQYSTEAVVNTVLVAYIVENIADSSSASDQ